jgi:hypothetical protein
MIGPHAKPSSPAMGTSGRLAGLLYGNSLLTVMALIFLGSPSRSVLSRSSPPGKSPGRCRQPSSKLKGTRTRSFAKQRGHESQVAAA